MDNINSYLEFPQLLTLSSLKNMQMVVCKISNQSWVSQNILLVRQPHWFPVILEHDHRTGVLGEAFMEPRRQKSLGTTDLDTRL